MHRQQPLPNPNLCSECQRHPVAEQVQVHSDFGYWSVGRFCNPCGKRAYDRLKARGWKTRRRGLNPWNLGSPS